MFAGVLAGGGGDLGGQEREQGAVLVGGPDCTVALEEARAGGFFAAEADRAVVQAGGEPLEADGDLVEPSAEAGDDAVDQAAADQGFADRGGWRPLRAVRQQVADRDGEVVV